MNKTKTLGQVFTPPHIVKTILDETGYSGEQILTKNILEPSFGDAVFIYEIIERIYEQGLKQNLTLKEISSTIDENVWGIEYDQETYNTATEKLKEWATQTYGIKLQLPKLILGDTLNFTPTEKFDFIVGNPPYVRIHNIPNVLRESLKNYEHTTGNTDLYVIFFEIGLLWLKQEGKIGFITPNSWFKNSSQKNLRKNLIENKQIVKIINYGSAKIFPTAGTYTAITILRKNSSEQSYKYVNHNPPFSKEILFENNDLKAGAPWIFTSEEDQTFLNKLKGNKIEELFNVQNGLATLGDKYFILNKEESQKLGLEEKYLRTAVKASTFKGKDQNTVIIFPYIKNEFGQWKGVTEEKIKEEAPEIYKYLLKNKTKLESRSLDKNSLWFWYGRSQAIQSVEQPKIVLAPLLKDTDKSFTPHIIPGESLIYSGLFISHPKTTISLELLLPKISDEKFATYLKLNSKDMSGGYKSFNSRTVKHFPTGLAV